jgi:DNA-binding LacI/PurR family transcriptional regulator
MALNTASDVRISTGRTSVELAKVLRAQVVSRKVGPGEFLPPVRELAATHAAAYKTVRRALKILEGEGLVTAIPRKGYRVLDRPEKPREGSPLAYLWSDVFSGTQGQMGATNTSVLRELGVAADAVETSVLAVRCSGSSPNQVMSKLREAKSCGVIVDVSDMGVAQCVAASGLPAVMVNAWPLGCPMNTVLQDGFGGGALAASWLVERGHERIGWIGPDLSRSTMLSVERYSGVTGMLASHGLSISDQHCCQVPLNDMEAAYEAAHRLLSSRDRPSAVLALWQGMAGSVAMAARDLGLVLGRDLDMVGWSTEEQYGSTYKQLFARGPVPATITWSVREMADVAVDLIMRWHSNRNISPVRSCVGTTLRPLASSASAVSDAADTKDAGQATEDT